MIVVPKKGARRMAIQLTNAFNIVLPEIRLYINDYNPTLDSLLPDFDQATYPGYAPHAPVGWSFIGLEPETHSRITTIPGTFVATAVMSPPQRIFGYYVVDVPDGEVLWAERFPFRFHMKGPSTPLIFRVNLGLLSEFSG